MKLLLDMGLAPRTATFLRNGGHDALHLTEEGLQKLSDDRIVEKAAAEGRVVVTFDLDFAAIIALQRLANHQSFSFVWKSSPLIELIQF